MAVTRLVKADADGDVIDYSGRKLATKQSVTDLTTVVGTKADTSALATKADASALSAKADVSALNSLAPKASPTFTGTVSGISKTMVGLGSVDNTADTAKPVSTPQQTAIDAKLTAAKAGKPITLTYSGPLVAGQGVTELPIFESCTLLLIRARLGTAATGSSVIIDVNKNGTTIFATAGNKPTFAAGSKVDNTPGTDASTTTFTDGDFLTVDVDQVGSTTPGSDLTFTIVLLPT